MSGSDFCAVHGGTIKLGASSPGDLQNRCVAKSTRSGEQCKKSAIRGSTVCKTHGGAAKQVAKKARERLMEMVEPALVQLIRIVEQPGTSDSDRLRAIQMVLDRTGYGPGKHVEVEVRPWEVAMQHVFRQQPQIVRELPESDDENVEVVRHMEFDYSESYDIVDAEIVEDDNVVPFRRVGSSMPPKHQR